VLQKIRDPQHKKGGKRQDVTRHKTLAAKRKSIALLKERATTPKKSSAAAKKKVLPLPGSSWYARALAYRLAYCPLPTSSFWLSPFSFLSPFGFRLSPFGFRLSFSFATVPGIVYGLLLPGTSSPFLAFTFLLAFALPFGFHLSFGFASKPTRLLYQVGPIYHVWQNFLLGTRYLVPLAGTRYRLAYCPLPTRYQYQFLLAFPFRLLPFGFRLFWLSPSFRFTFLSFHLSAYHVWPYRYLVPGNQVPLASTRYRLHTA